MIHDPLVEGSRGSAGKSTIHDPLVEGSRGFLKTSTIHEGVTLYKGGGGLQSDVRIRHGPRGLSALALAPRFVASDSQSSACNTALASNEGPYPSENVAGGLRTRRATTDCYDLRAVADI